MTPVRSILIYLLLSGILSASAENSPVVGEVLGQPIRLSDISPSKAEISQYRAHHTENETIAWILTRRAENLSVRVLVPMAARYLKHNLAEPIPDDLLQLQTQYEKLNPGKTMTTARAADWWRTWKLNQLLLEEFGGRTVQRNFGLEAVEAMGKYLRFQEATGGFIVENTTLRSAMYHYFETDNFHQWHQGGTAPWMSSPLVAMRLAHAAELKKTSAKPLDIKSP